MLANHLILIKKGRGDINLHNRSTNNQNRLPLIPIQWNNREQSLQNRGIEERKMQRHRKSNSVNQHHIFPEWKSKKGFARRKRIDCIEHFDDNEN